MGVMFNSCSEINAVFVILISETIYLIETEMS